MEKQFLTIAACLACHILTYNSGVPVQHVAASMVDLVSRCVATTVSMFKDREGAGHCVVHCILIHHCQCVERISHIAKVGTQVCQLGDPVAIRHLAWL